MSFIDPMLVKHAFCGFVACWTKHIYKIVVHVAVCWRTFPIQIHKEIFVLRVGNPMICLKLAV